jgi:hypothetical protein
MKKQIKWMAVATAMAVGSVVAAPTASIATGATTVAADAGFLAAAKSLSVTVAPITGKKLMFKILAGNIDLANAKGEILHDGGLVLKSATTTVELRNFIIDTTGDGAVLTGLVVANEVTVGRLPLFDLGLPAGLGASLPLKAKGATKALTLSGVSLKLSDGAATALNGAFKVSAFKAGLQIGTAKVQAFGLKNK